ncbi:hypothetical protein EBH_0082110 [Eimeria brunetti]|uniref:Chromo domain-containing protein n=1 Tax=Eimeria brunetti TaxID=51314 RepID=U6LG40_9EIME|nr:hypothetical protein EBH_0082110 [Eimeria brunetti]
MFLGPAFADMARPLVELTKKDAPFVWTEKHTAAVKALKHTLVNYTTLQTPDAKSPYVLRTDAPGYALGGVLEQDGKPLGFMSMKMSPAEQRYSLEFLMDFQDLKVEYRPGANSVVADALSRCPYYQPVEAETLRDAANDTTEVGNCFLVRAADEDLQESQRYTKVLTPLQEGEKDRQWKVRIGGSWWFNALQQCNELSAALTTVLNHNQQPVMAQIRGQQHEFKHVRKLLLVRIQGLWRICVPTDRVCRQHVMYQAHDHPTAGHMGVRKTYDALSRLFYWPQMRSYVNTYVESCPRCRAAKTISAKPAGLLQSLQIPNRRWAQVSLDFITALPLTDKGHDAILTLVDTISKMAHFVPTKTTATAADTLELLADRVMEPLLYPVQSEKGLVKLLEPPNRRPNGEGAPDRDKPRPQGMLEPECWDPIQEDRQAPDAEYEVEHLLGNRGEGRSEEFRVKWKGSPERAATSEPASNLTNSTNLIRAYRRRCSMKCLTI